MVTLHTGVNLFFNELKILHDLAILNETDSDRCCSDEKQKKNSWTFSFLFFAATSLSSLSRELRSFCSSSSLEPLKLARWLPLWSTNLQMERVKNTSLISFLRVFFVYFYFSIWLIYWILWSVAVIPQFGLADLLKSLIS